MCLSKITKIYKEPDPKERIGYKVVDLSADRTSFDFECCSLRKKPYHKTNVWLKAETSKNIRIGFDDDVSYKSGFHIFASKKGAEDWDEYEEYDVVKVKYRGLTTTGFQDNFKTVIAKEIKVLI